MGIPGNELADRSAKQALDQNITTISIPFTDKIPDVKLALIKAWQQEWNSSLNNKLYQIKPQLGSPFIVRTCRKDQVVLNRIRIGHSRLSHSFLMNQRNAPRPRCHFCRFNKELTIRHIMIKCQYFTVIRSNYFNVHNMRDLIKNVRINNTLGYLKETSLYQ